MILNTYNKLIFLSLTLFSNLILSQTSQDLLLNNSANIYLRGARDQAGDVIFQQNNKSQMGRVWAGNSRNGVALYLSSADNTSDITINNRGNVGIGTNTPKNKLSVNGHIWAKEIKVMLEDGADWVDEFRKNDMKVSEMTNKLLQKIEELTLYAIQQDKENKKLRERVKKIEKLLTK